MTDLGELLGTVEDHVERVHRGAAPAPVTIALLRRRVRRQRVVRHARDGALAGVASVVVVAVAWWAAPDAGRPAPPPAATPTQAPTAPPTAAAPAPAAEPAGPRTVVATPLAVPDGLLASAGEGWLLAESGQYRAGIDEDGVLAPDAMRTTVDVVDPAGVRTAVLEVDARTTLGLHAWPAGGTYAVASARGADDVLRSGWLDLVTGELVELPLPWDRQPLGVAVTGESLWVGRDAPAELADEVAAGTVSPAFPGTLVGWEPESTGTDPGRPAATAGAPAYEGHLQALAPDGTARELGIVAIPQRLQPLSPDRAWLVLQDAAGDPVALDVRDGAIHPLTAWPDGTACRPDGWAGDHDVLVACEQPDGSWRLLAVDVAQGSASRALGTSDVPVRQAWPLADGRVALGRVTVPAPCDVTGDPAVLADGAVRSLTDDWSPYDHGTGVVVAGDAVWTHLNGCYPGSGRADLQRDVRVDTTTGALTTLAWLEARAPQQVVVDGWRVASVDAFVPAR
ncbi:hypothetical protein ACFUMH_03740 [Cellulomonas sp. NPDC057328]|uniref:hypothetical protein n=1 Tax=Cellulomonas sp. NPDC057328 TaxID=3346101 RepID=UPI003626B7E6